MAKETKQYSLTEVSSIPAIIQRVKEFNDKEFEDENFKAKKLVSYRHWVVLSDEIVAPLIWVAFLDVDEKNFTPINTTKFKKKAENIITKLLGEPITKDDKQQHSECKKIVVELCKSHNNGEKPSFQKEKASQKGRHPTVFWLIPPQTDSTKQTKNKSASQSNEEEDEELIFPEEDELNNFHIEGAKKQITVNAYERDKKARKKCIEHYKKKDGKIQCQSCDFNFEDMYGDLGTDYIHVHHKKPLKEIGEEYKVDPINDLIPLCCNCHAMIHRDGTIKVEKLQEIIKDNKGK